MTASGVVGPTATTPVSARVTGTIEALHCDANMQVKAGQLCAKIDPRPYQIAVDQSRADLAAAEARLEKDNAELAQAKAAFESHEALAKRPAISRKATDKSRKAFERAQTQTKRDEARGSPSSKRRFMPPRPTSAIPISFRRPRVRHQLRLEARFWRSPTQPAFTQSPKHCWLTVPKTGRARGSTLTSPP